MKQNMTGQVFVFIGYGQNEDGEILINNDVWSILSRELINNLLERGAKKILCRINLYENQEEEIEKIDSLNLPIYNEYFVLDVS